MVKFFPIVYHVCYTMWIMIQQKISFILGCLGLSPRILLHSLWHEASSAPTCKVRKIPLGHHYVDGRERTPNQQQERMPWQPNMIALSGRDTF